MKLIPIYNYLFDISEMTINNFNFCDGDQKNSQESEMSRGLLYA